MRSRAPIEIPPLTKISRTMYAGRAMITGRRRRERAEVVEDGAEPDDGRREGRAEPGRLIFELLHPVVVDAARGRVGCEAFAEVPLQPIAHRQRERQADEQRQQPHSDKDRRRGVHAPNPVTPRSIEIHAILRAGLKTCAKRPVAHTSAAHDSRQSCSHTIHFMDHFVAASGPLGTSVFELFVVSMSSSSTRLGSTWADTACAARS